MSSPSEQKWPRRTKDCQICLEPLGYSSPEMDCSHEFHEECLNRYIKNQLAQRKLPIKCPQEGCNRDLHHGLITPIEPAILKLNLQASLQKYIAANLSRIVFCPGLNCRYLFEYTNSCPIDRIIRLKVCLGCLKSSCKCRKQFACPRCKTQICLLCLESHAGLSCGQHRLNKKIDLDFNAFVDCLRKNQFKRCPSCRSWVEKSEGCNHMICRCRYQFCYKCNGRYGTCLCISSPNQEVNVSHIYPQVTRPFRGVTSGRPVKTLPGSHRSKPSEAARLKIQKYPFWVRKMRNKQL